MENIGEFMQGYATKEVFTVISAIAVAWVGWKAATKTVGMAKGFAQKASFAGLTSAFLLLAGFGGLGAGIGELASRTTEPETGIELQLSNQQLMELARRNEKGATEEVLKYATTRDKAARETWTPNPTMVDSQGRTWVVQEEKEAEAIQVAYDQPQEPRPYEELPFEVEEQQAAIKNDESIMTTPMAWTTIGFGLAALIGSFSVFSTRKIV